MAKGKDLFKQYSETIIPNQSIDFLNANSKNNRSHNSPKTKASAKSIDKWSTVFDTNLNKRANVDPAATNGFELFTRLAYCQALLYKAWVEASDKVACKVTGSVDHGEENSNALSVYIDTFEDTFTNLFRSPEFASNVGKLLNSLMEYTKERDNISKLFDSYKILEIARNRKGSMNDVKRNK